MSSIRSRIHAAGRLDTTAGAILVAGTGNWSAANIAVGVADITLNDPIDVAERVVICTSRTQSWMVATVAASDSDTNVRVSQEDDTSTAQDGPVDFVVLRVSQG